MRKMSIITVSVLHAVREGVAFGFDILDATGLESGTVYPILSRLENDGLVKSTWEADAKAHAKGRPARRYYSITPAGRTALEDATRHYAQLVPAFGRGKKSR